jgi:selenocysteine lyase/cysteine desulfurase
MGEIRAYERTLAERLIAGLRSIDGCAIYGITDSARFAWRVPTVACRLEGYTPRQVAERLADEGIFVWDGNYYAPAVMQRLGLQDSGGAVRIGPVHYNTAAEIDRTLDVLGTMARG